MQIPIIIIVDDCCTRENYCCVVFACFGSISGDCDTWVKLDFEIFHNIWSLFEGKVCLLMKIKNGCSAANCNQY